MTEPKSKKPKLEEKEVEPEQDSLEICRLLVQFGEKNGWTNDQIQRKLYNLGYCSSCFQSTGFKGAQCVCIQSSDIIREFLPTTVLADIAEAYTQPVTVHITRLLGHNDILNDKHELAQLFHVDLDEVNFVFWDMFYLDHLRGNQTLESINRKSCRISSQITSQSIIALEHKNGIPTASIFVQSDQDVSVFELKHEVEVPQITSQVDKNRLVCACRKADGEWALVIVDMTKRQIHLGRYSSGSFHWSSITFQIIHLKNCYNIYVCCQLNERRVLLLVETVIALCSCGRLDDSGDHADCGFNGGGNEVFDRFEIPFDVFENGNDIRVLTTKKFKDATDKEIHYKRVIPLLTDLFTLKWKDFIFQQGYCLHCLRRFRFCKDRPKKLIGEWKRARARHEDKGLVVQFKASDRLRISYTNEKGGVFLYETGAWVSDSPWDEKEQTILLNSVWHRLYRLEHHPGAVILHWPTDNSVYLRCVKQARE